MSRSLRRVAALVAVLTLMVLGLVPVASADPSAPSQDCASYSPSKPVLTGYGVMSTVSCGRAGTGATNSVTCVFVYATYLGYSNWIPFGGAENCNSNGPLLDFAPCLSGTYRYMTVSATPNSYPGGSEEVSIKC